MEPVPGLLVSILAAHPYGDAMLGDLAERHAEIEAAHGPGTARAWRRRELVRTAATILARLPVPAGEAIRTTVIVLGAYMVATQGASVATISAFRLTGARGIWAGVLVLAIVALAGALAAVAVRVSCRAVVGSTLLLVTAAAIGALHVVTGSPHERVFRTAKVVLFLTVLALGFVRPQGRTPSPA